MSGEAGDQQDRTEAPTAKRLQKAQEEGESPVSREAVQLASLCAAFLMLTLLENGVGTSLLHPLAGLLSEPGLGSPDPFALFHAVAVACAVAIGPLVIPTALASAAATLAQTRFRLRTSALHADFGRLSPGRGLKRLLGVESLVETAKSIAKLAIVGGAVAQVLWGELPRLQALPSTSLTLLPGVVIGAVNRVLLAVILALTVIVGADVFWLHRQHLQRLRMSRSEIKSETKDAEGDPAIKMRIRRIRVRRARQRMLAAVPTATVVVTNPTHYAVALTYDRDKSSVPVLVAKGVDSLAARIRETAMEHGVPVVANPPLARTLHQLPLGSAIPAELYKVVAELIAYVWRLYGVRPS
jgi:flagellar biosynthetic protein FlhB